MKLCPKCKRKYEDDTLKFCLEDGAALSVVARDPDPPATEFMPRVQPTLKSSAGSTIPSYPNAGDFRPPQSEARASNPILTAGVVAIVLLLVALVGIAAYFVFKQTSDNSAKTSPSSSATATQGASPTVREGSTNSSTSAGNTEITSSNSQTGTPLKITGSASSVRLAVQSNTYYPANAIDGKRSTAWIEGVDGPGLGVWIRFDFTARLVCTAYLSSPAISRAQRSGQRTIAFRP